MKGFDILLHKYYHGYLEHHVDTKIKAAQNKYI